MLINDLLANGTAWLVERAEDVAFTAPKDLRIEMIAPGKKLDVMLAEGEIPAMLSPELPRPVRAAATPVSSSA